MYKTSCLVCHFFEVWGTWRWVRLVFRIVFLEYCLPTFISRHKGDDKTGLHAAKCLQESSNPASSRSSRLGTRTVRGCVWEGTASHWNQVSVASPPSVRSTIWSRSLHGLALCWDGGAADPDTTSEVPVGPTVSPEPRLNHNYTYLHIYCDRQCAQYSGWLYSPLFYLFSINPLYEGMIDIQKAEFGDRLHPWSHDHSLHHKRLFIITGIIIIYVYGKNT